MQNINGVVQRAYQDQVASLAAALFRGWSGGGVWGSGGALPPGWGYGWAWGAWVLVGVPPGAWVGACAWARLWCGGLRCIGASAVGGGPIEAG